MCCITFLLLNVRGKNVKIKEEYFQYFLMFLYTTWNNRHFVKRKYLTAFNQIGTRSIFSSGSGYFFSGGLDQNPSIPALPWVSFRTGSYPACAENN